MRIQTTPVDEFPQSRRRIRIEGPDGKLLCVLNLDEGVLEFQRRRKKSKVSLVNLWSAFRSLAVYGEAEQSSWEDEENDEQVTSRKTMA